VGHFTRIAPNPPQFVQRYVLALEDVSVEDGLVMAARELNDDVVHLSLECGIPN
jgi:hypothetical protein